MEKKHLKTLFFIITVVILLINTGVFLYSLNNAGIIHFSSNAVAEASISFCNDPFLEVHNITTTCDSEHHLHINENYLCQINYTKRDNATIYFEVENKPDNLSSFQVTTEGLINYTADDDVWDNHSAVITVREEDGPCSPNITQNRSYNYEFETIFNNTAPEYYKEIPNVTMPQDSVKYPYYLHDYFKDIDEQPLTYGFLTSSPPSETVTITVNSTTGKTKIESGSEAGTYYLSYFAEDTYENYVLSEPTPKLVISEDADLSEGEEGGGSGGIRDCIEEWECQDWSDCYTPTEDMPEYPNGYRKRLCYDKNACDSDNYKVTRYEECNYTEPPGCYPEWECTQWTPCQKDGTKKRTCKDLNECSLEEQKRYGIPETEELCVYPESCFDGVRNGDELGVDCGGSCEPCKTVELASTIDDNNKVLTWAISIIIVLFVVLSVLYWIFRKNIKIILSKIIWALVKKKARQIFLLGKDKKEILKELREYEKLLKKNIKKTNKKKLDLLESKLYVLFRKFISKILDTEMTATIDEIKDKLHKLNTTKEFRNMIASITEKLLEEEKSGKKILLSRFNDIIIDYNIIKFLIFNTSDEVDEDFKKIKLKPKKEGKSYAICKLLTKTYIELQKENVNIGKDNYIKIIRIYESMKEHEKALFYESTKNLLNALTYLSTHVK